MKKISSILSNKKYKYTLYILAAFVCSYLLFPAGFDNPVQPYNGSQPWWALLDTSWIISLNYANLKDFVWGHDFAFTYGPLGFLSTRFGWGVSKYDFLAFDLFLFINWALLFYFSLKDSKNKLLTLFLIISVTLFLPVWIGSKISIYLLLFLVFWIRQSLDSFRIINYIMQISIVVLCFFIKFNSSLIGLFIFFLCLFYKLYRKEINIKQFILISILPLLIIYSLSRYFNLKIMKYVWSGLELVSGYNDVMHEEVELPNTYAYVGIIALIVLSTLVYNFFKRKDQDILKRLLIAGITFIPFYIAYKQGFVRSNPDYNSDFFASLLIFFLVETDLHYQVKNKLLQLSLILAVLTSLHFLYIKREKPLELEYKMSKQYYIDGFKNFNTNSDLIFKNNAPKFPAHIVNKIKNETVDSFPWNVRMLYENNLNYSPRPVIQAYATYTPYLEELNVEFYNSKNAPQYVVYEYSSLDNRYPLFDESKINIVLKENYQVDEVFDYESRKLILFKKKQDFKPIQFTQTKEYAIFLNKPFVPEKDVYYQIEVYENLLGKAYSGLKHAPALTLKVYNEDGSKFEYKTSKNLLETGIFGNNFLGETNDFYDICTKNESNKKVKCYEFVAKDPIFFKDKIRVKEFKITKQ